MERFEEEKARAKKHITIADHMLTQTYPLLQDPKLLLSVVDNIARSAMASVRSALFYERLYKRIPPFPAANEDVHIDLFRKQLLKKYGLHEKYLTVLDDARAILQEHHKSPLEFSRREKFVICSDSYRMKTITTKELKDYVYTIKEFVSKIDEVVSKHERLFHRSA